MQSSYRALFFPQPPSVRAVACILIMAGLGSGCGGGGGDSASNNTAAPPALSLSSAGLTFDAVAVGSSGPTQSVTLTNAGQTTLSVSNISLGGPNATSFTQMNTCSASLSAGANCAITVSFAPAAVGALTANLSVTDNAAGSPQSVVLSGAGNAAPAAVLSLSATVATFAATPVGASSATQTITVQNTGNAALIISGIAMAGANASSFAETNTCATVAAGGSCAITVGFSPTAVGALSASISIDDNAADSPQSVSLTGTGSMAAASAPLTVDCSVSTALCPALVLKNDPIASGGFHGYADPSMRKDPNSSLIYFAYSWAHTLSDGTHVVDLHLASSNDGGATFGYVGALYQSIQTTQSSSTAYSSTNDSSTETIDLLPIALTGSDTGKTLWVQAHQSYLVAPQTAIYNQLTATNLISITAVEVNSQGNAAPAALLALSAAGTPEARLAASGTDASRNVTQALYPLAAATQKCAQWGQPTLWYQDGTLFLALECAETPGNGNIDSHELSHFMFATTPVGSDASQWNWSYVGEFATGADASKLGTAEGTAYAFFTEPQLVAMKSGQLALLVTPGAFAPNTDTQPVIQYGCRVIPITLTPTSVSLVLNDMTHAPSVAASVTESDLYTGANEGPAACTYESAASSGIVMGRKYENDPTEGFYIYPLSSGLSP